MKTAEKAKPSASSSKPASSPFFNKEAGNGLYDSENPSFFQSSSPFIQSKPDPRPPIDSKEQEPDPALDQILQESGIKHYENPPFFKSEFSSTSPIQTNCADCKEEQVQKKEEPEEEVSLQRKSIFESNDDPANSIQAKLTVGQPGDKYEQEADAMADQVVQKLAQPEVNSNTSAVGNNPNAPYISFLVQKQSDASEQDELQRKEDPEEELNLQRKGIFESNKTQDNLQMKFEDCGNIGQSKVMAKENGSGQNSTSNLEQRLQNSSSNGQSLSPDTNSQMGSAFGTDFSNVNIHTGSDAVQMNKQLGAQAFTHGNDIYFNEGKYNPGSSDGNRLLAHELTHTVQQGGGAFGKSVQKVDEPAQEEPTLPTTQVDITQGLELNQEWRSYLDAQRGVRDFDLPAKIGNDYEGILKINRIGRLVEGQPRKYDLSGPSQYMDIIGMSHLDFLRNQGITPILVLRNFGQEQSTKGFLSIKLGERVIGNVLGLIRGINQNLENLGFLGLDEFRIPEGGAENSFENGSLTFQLTDLSTTVDGYLEASGGLGIQGNAFTFNITANVSVAGLAEGEFSLARNEQGLLEGSANIDANIANVEANLLVLYENGSVTIQGTGRMQSEKFSGSITLLVTDRNRSTQMMHAALGVESMEEEAESTEQPTVPKTPQNQVLVGWGEITATITPWLEGTAKVGIDAEGHVTIVGEIIVTEEVELMEQRGRKVDLFNVEIRAGYGIPLVGQVFLFASIGMFVNAGFGPLVLRDIGFTGTYSTDPDVLQQFSITGTLSINAFAVLGLEAEAGVGLTLIGHDIKAGVNVTAAAGLRAYAEATPIFEYLESAAPEGGKVGESHLRGHFEAAAQLFLQLSGALFYELDSPWWSPAPDGREESPLGEVQYPIGDSMGIGADIDWLVGSPGIPEIEFSPVEFDPEKFTADVMADPPPRRSGESESSPAGEWEDGSAQSTLGENPEALEGGEGLPPNPQQEENLRNLPDEQRYMRGLDEISRIADSRERPTISLVESKINQIKRRYNLDQVALRDEQDSSVKVYVSHAQENNANHLVEVPVMSEAERLRLLNEALQNLDSRMNQQAGEAGTLSQSDARSVSEPWQAAYPIIESVRVIDGRNSWDFQVDIGDRNQRVPGKGKTEAVEELPTNPEDESGNIEENATEDFQIIGLRESVNIDSGHLVIIEGSIERPEIVIHSQRIGLNELLRIKQEEIHRQRGEGVNVVEKDGALNILNSEKRTFGQNIAAYRAATRRVYTPEGGGNTAIRIAYDGIKLSIETIASNLEIIGVQLEEVDIPETRVLQTEEAGKAKRVIAQPLTKFPGNTRGGAPSQNPEGWNEIPPNERSGGWVRAHLLNHQLHGPGVRWNLFPGRGRLNTAQMENEVERPAKRMLWRENKVLYYSVLLVYGNTDEFKPFPTEIHMEFGEFDHINNRRADLPIVRTVFSQNPPDQLYITNLNTDSASRLKETALANGIKGVGGIIDKIVLERGNNDFVDDDDIENRIDLHYKNKTAFITALNKIKILKNELKVMTL